MGKLRRSARLSAARSGEASTSRAPSSSSKERLPPRCGFHGQKRKNQASSSTSQANSSPNSVDSKKSANSPTSGVSTSGKEKTVHGLERIAIPACDLVRVALPVFGSKEYTERVEAIAMVISMGNENLMRESKNWNLSWSCSLKTHDTDMLKTIWC